MEDNQQEEFLLKWNDHHNSFFAIMQDLCSSEVLTDVTLACGGQVKERHIVDLRNFVQGMRPLTLSCFFPGL